MIPANLFNPDKEYQLLYVLVCDPFVTDTKLIDPKIFTAKPRQDILDIINKVIRNSGGNDGFSIISHELETKGYSLTDAMDEFNRLINDPQPVWYWDRLLHDLTALHKRRVQYQVGEKIAARAINGDDSDFTALLAGIDDIDKAAKVNKTLYTMAEIAAMKFEPIRYFVDDILPPGLVFLAGRPKARKSWLALQIAVAVGTGSALFGKKTRKGKVVYIALEDSLRRLQGRITKQKGPSINEVKFMLAEDFTNLEDAKRLLLDCDLLIVDTFTRSTGSDQVDPVAMRNILSPLQTAAMGLDKCILVVDHMPKGRGNDSLGGVTNDLYGSVSKSGVADAIIGLYRDNDESGVFIGTGRDIMDFELNLLWDNETCTWSSQSNVMIDRLGYSENRLAVLSTIVEAMDISQLDIAAVTGLNKGSVSRIINDLLSAGYILKYQDGKRIMYQASVAGRQDILPKWESKSMAAANILQGRLYGNL